MAKKAVIGVLILAVVIVGGLFGYVRIEGRAVDSTSKATQIFTVEQGTGAAQIGSSLKTRGLIRSYRAFMLQAKFSGSISRMQAGSYAFSKSMSMSEMIDDMVSGDTAGQTFTVTEGMSMEKIAVMLAKQGICTKKAFYAAAEKKNFEGYKFSKYLSDDKAANRLEGFLYPDTYEVAIGASPKEVLDVMLKNFDAHVTDKYYKEAKKQGTNIFKIVTAASIIQREAGVTDDMPKVASVIYNRLDADMYLQMDSILSYITNEDKVIASYGDTKIDSAYNPYKNKGLPPGPICSPGIDAIEASLKPADTKYLYFVDSEKLDGTLNFSDNEKQFYKDKAAFEKAYKKSQENK
ncbi:MAG: endolytic transglycosylase MltG [Eubacteriaceae bacterium]|jgi:UPF0755 protein|nr:endolytic transglycosylase MltG [Eubacteriaceae bacterium]